MSEKEIFKLGYYSFYKVMTENGIIYRVDSGKTIFIARFNKYIINPYRDIREFGSMEEAKKYVTKKLAKRSIEKKKKLKKIPKSLYLILMKEENTGKRFVKVGITSKKYIVRRFSKEYGYNGYTVVSVLRRIENIDAEKMEKNIKDALNKKRSIKKYRPILESFSGYSECYDYLCLDEIVKIFDELVHLGAK